MVQFAPIKEENPKNDAIGIVGNIYIFDIISPRINPAADGFVAIAGGMVPANMIYGFNPPIPLWMPNNSAFVATFDQYLAFKEEKLVEFANQIPGGLLSQQLFGGAEVEDIQAKKDFIERGGNFGFFLPNFYHINGKDIIDIDSIKYEYCRYDRNTSEFIDCGKAEFHELGYMSRGTRKVIIEQSPESLGEKSKILCEHCPGWIVSCRSVDLNSFALVLDPSSKDLLQQLEDNGVFYKKFKSLEEAKKFMREENAKTKWVVRPIQEASVCEEICEICMESREGLIDCGPFDNLTDCESCEERWYCDSDPEEEDSDLPCVKKTVAVGKVENPEQEGEFNSNQCNSNCSRRWYCRPNGNCEQLYPFEVPDGDLRYGYFLESRCNEECTKAWFCVENQVTLTRFCDRLDKSDPAVEGLTPYNSIEECEQNCGGNDPTPTPTPSEPETEPPPPDFPDPTSTPDYI